MGLSVGICGFWVSGFDGNVLFDMHLQLVLTFLWDFLNWVLSVLDVWV